MINALTQFDIISLGLFVLAWLIFEFLTDYSALQTNSLSALMGRQRRSWMLEMADRDLRMIDTQIIHGLQNGAAFFGSACIFAIGGSFALMGATEDVIRVYKDLRGSAELTRQLFELKVIGLSVIFIYSFFKFAWSYRLFNYCSIMIGSVPMLKGSSDEARKKAALAAADMNITASRHFTAGLRGIFFALAYLGWFVNPWVFLSTTAFVILVLLRRNYFSRARAILADLE